MTFRIGQKVVCVDAAKRYHDITLIKGRIYTIAGYGKAERGPPSVFLDEARAALQQFGYGFFQDRFRPLIERKKETDISIFTKMLDGSPLSIEPLTPVAHGNPVEQV